MSFIDVFAAFVLVVLVLTAIATFIALGAASGYIAKQLQPSLGAGGERCWLGDTHLRLHLLAARSGVGLR